MVVGLISLVSGGWSIPTGFALGLPPLQIYVAASVGAMLGMSLFLFAGDALRERIMRDRAPREPDPDSRLGRIVEKNGTRGLGLVGPLFPGVTASVLVGIALGVDRGALGRWMSVGIAAMFALYTAVLWLLIEVVGID